MVNKLRKQLTERRIPALGRDDLGDAIFLGNGADLIDIVEGVAFKLLDRGEKHGTGGQEQPTAVLWEVPIEAGIFDGLLQETLLFGRLRTGKVCVRGLPPTPFAPFKAHGPKREINGCARSARVCFY